METKAYVLYNTKTKKPLTHPRVGLWHTTDKSEAEALLKDFHDLVRDMGQEALAEHLVVREIKDITYQ